MTDENKVGKAYVLLSGGMDSTVCLYDARKNYKVVEGIGIYYGQKHSKENDIAKALCEKLGIKYTVLDATSILQNSGSMLTDPDAVIPETSYAEIDGTSPMEVPFRNGLFLSMLTSYVQAEISRVLKDLSTGQEGCYDLDDDTHEAISGAGIYFGAHSEDARNWAYPDCTPEFIGAMANAIWVGSQSDIRLHTPLMNMTKAEVVAKGHSLGVDLGSTWSCYVGKDKQCGKCATCQSRKEAFKIAGVADSTDYEDENHDGD